MPDAADPAGLPTWVRPLFFAAIVRPALLIGFGLGMRHRERLPQTGPAIVVANHNSHLDTLLLLSLFRLSTLGRVRPAAAADYFGKAGVVRWVTQHLIGAILIERHHEGGRRADPLAPLSAALERGEIVLLFPEGTRGQPEVREAFKTGLAHLARRHAGVPVIPVALRGLGHALPKGEWIPVPLNLYAAVGEAVQADPRNKPAFTAAVEAAIDKLDAELPTSVWD
ncbi:lysophospholipid acyltransferase family protein [Deinococcus alpinitundrae]|uniref:lysophospholipid acyltransferase family protein n=1 Tax=Deinococcus alpinitundrae TaxID=468913 RepID=UPI00137A98D0|nr:lysophospholipid acyltransferase family protein [Deinococcus alpinitundrae]